MIPLSCVISERAIISGICQHGSSAYFDVCDIISEHSFTIDSNQYIYKCIKEICEKDEKNNLSCIDIPSIHSKAKELGLENILLKKEEVEHLRAVTSLDVDKNNIRKFAAKIRKLEIARLLRRQLDNAGTKLLEVNGSESVLEIMNVAENAVFDFSSLLHDDNSPKYIGDGISDYVQSLIDNPVKQIGISSGYPIYDNAIGGGLCPASVNVIAARMKVGKSIFGLNIGYNVAKQGIPVLVMDTELVQSMNRHRLLAKVSGVSINRIKTGQFSESIIETQKVKDAAKHISEIPYYHKNISGMPFEEQVALMRRWLMKDVGLYPDGTAKKSVIVYDYIKLMNAADVRSNMDEYQLIGFLVGTLHNLSVKYNTSILAYCQTNRAGIDKSDTSVIGLSDRIAQLCTSLSLFQKKTDDEISEDGAQNGNRKMHILAARDGEGLEDSDYINLYMDGWKADIREGKLRSELLDEDNSSDEGFITEDDSDVPFE